MNDLEGLWDNLLSRDPERVRRQWRDLNAEERQAVLDHLARMVSEEGWLPMQRLSAQAALDAIETHKPPGDTGP